MQGVSAKEMQLSQGGTLVLQKSREVSQQLQQRSNVTSFSSLDVSVVQAYQGCCFSEGSQGSLCLVPACSPVRCERKRKALGKQWWVFNTPCQDLQDLSTEPGQ